MSDEEQDAAYGYACPVCHALPDDPCTSGPDGEVRDLPHGERRELADAAVARAIEREIERTA
jgi:hypothetical protein